MAITEKVIGVIADIGIDVAKKHFKKTLLDAKAKEQLSDYLAQQKNIILIVLWTKKLISRALQSISATISWMMLRPVCSEKNKNEE